MQTWTSRLLLWVLGALSIGFSSVDALGQSMVVPRVHQSRGVNGFHERFGVQVSASGGGPRGSWFYRSAALPPIPFARNASPAVIHAHGRAGNHRWRLGLYADQGSSQWYGGQSTTLVLPQGGTGSVMSGTWTPFVTGWVPVVGAMPMSPYYLSPYYLSPYYLSPYPVTYPLVTYPWSSYDIPWTEYTFEPVEMQAVSPVRERWQRLQWEKLQQLTAARAAARDNAELRDDDEPVFDENQPPPIPKPPRTPKPDDPPLILHGP